VGKIHLLVVSIVTLNKKVGGVRIPTGSTKVVDDLVERVAVVSHVQLRLPFLFAGAKEASNVRSLPVSSARSSNPDRRIEAAQKIEGV
jgi:hypothetical protein